MGLSRKNVRSQGRPVYVYCGWNLRIREYSPGTPVANLKMATRSGNPIQKRPARRGPPSSESSTSHGFKACYIQRGDCRKGPQEKQFLFLSTWEQRKWLLSLSLSCPVFLITKLNSYIFCLFQEGQVSPSDGLQGFSLPLWYCCLEGKLFPLWHWNEIENFPGCIWVRDWKEKNRTRLLYKNVACE